MLKKERILIVEDDPEVAEVLQWNLFAAGYAVTVVEDGLAALRAFDDEKPALVTIDLNVPTVSGFRLIKLFKRYAPKVPILVVTALTFEEAEETARVGVEDFITKPFDPYDLLRKIEYFLERRRLSDAPRPVPLPPPVPPVSVSPSRTRGASAEIA
ncbi:MAG TPA: response regulator [Chloroflexota bacterium]|nr:response regulator [Chloroflexota bacterium]